jgi:hypothetical protein
LVPTGIGIAPTGIAPTGIGAAGIGAAGETGVVPVVAVVKSLDMREFPS